MNSIAPHQFSIMAHRRRQRVNDDLRSTRTAPLMFFPASRFTARNMAEVNAGSLVWRRVDTRGRRRSAPEVVAGFGKQRRSSFQRLLIRQPLRLSRPLMA
jgi:hypothetical protein